LFRQMCSWQHSYSSVCYHVPESVHQRGPDRLPDEGQRQVTQSQQPKADTEGEDDTDGQDGQDPGILGSLRVCLRLPSAAYSTASRQ